MSSDPKMKPLLQQIDQLFKELGDPDVTYFVAAFKTEGAYSTSNFCCVDHLYDSVTGMLAMMIEGNAQEFEKPHDH